MPLEISPITVNPLPRIYADHTHIQATLNGLDGVYISRDLYARYVSVCREDGIIPATHNQFSRQLTAAGYHSRRDPSGNRRCWIIPAASR